MTIATGVVPDALVAALVALFHMTTESGSPAYLDRIHDAELGTGQQGMVGFTVAAEDVRHFQSLMFHRFALRSIAELQASARWQQLVEEDPVDWL